MDTPESRRWRVNRTRIEAMQDRRVLHDSICDDFYAPPVRDDDEIIRQVERDLRIIKRALRET